MGLESNFEYSDKKTDIFWYFYFEIVHIHNFLNKPTNPSDLVI